ncbi:MAG: IS1634 family transposase [Candidatus Brocadia sp.]|nr:MAG: IS1634 family transposase [Candidatus Brocadia sp.]
MLELDTFWRMRLPSSRKGTSWLNILKALVCYRLIDPGSEFRFHREWYVRSATGDLLGEDYSLAQKDKAYRCLDLLLEHRDELFAYLKEKWGKLFGAKYDVLLYDLTSTYFESDPPPTGSGSKKRFGYSRDKRSDCVQVVVALVLTPEGFPVAYEVYPGNTRDTATLEEFLDRIEKQYGKFRRTWLMDRGIPTEEMLEKMRERGIDYLVGTPKGHLTRVEKPLLEQTWMQARESVRVKVLRQESEFYVYVESHDRVSKERAMRRRRLRRLWMGLRELRNRKALTRDDLLMHIGALKKEAGRDYRLVTISIPKPQEPVNENTFRFSLDRERLRQAYRREGRYLLRSNMQAAAPETVWENYLLLTRIEQAFKDLKGSLSVRPLWHQLERRIEAHIFVSFLAFCLHTTLRNLARGGPEG